MERLVGAGVRNIEPLGIELVNHAELERLREDGRFISLIYSYEASHLLLDAIKRAADKARRLARGRNAVVDASFHAKCRQGALGACDIDETGDTTMSDSGVYLAKSGKLCSTT